MFQAIEDYRTGYFQIYYAADLCAVEPQPCQAPGRGGGQEVGAVQQVQPQPRLHLTLPGVWQVCQHGPLLPLHEEGDPREAGQHDEGAGAAPHGAPAAAQLLSHSRFLCPELPGHSKVTETQVTLISSKTNLTSAQLELGMTNSLVGLHPLTETLKALPGSNPGS